MHQSIIRVFFIHPIRYDFVCCILFRECNIIYSVDISTNFQKQYYESKILVVDTFSVFIVNLWLCVFCWCYVPILSGYTDFKIYETFYRPLTIETEKKDSINFHFQKNFFQFLTTFITISITPIFCSQSLIM